LLRGSLCYRRRLAKGLEWSSVTGLSCLLLLTTGRFVGKFDQKLVVVLQLLFTFQISHCLLDTASLAGDAYLLLSSTLNQALTCREHYVMGESPTSGSANLDSRK
jgi:hypothetical protein